MIIAVKGKVINAQPFSLTIDVNNTYWKINVLKKDFDDVLGSDILLFIARGSKGETYGFKDENDRNKFMELTKESLLDPEKVYDLLLLNNDLTKESLQKISPRTATENFLTRVKAVEEALRNLGYSPAEIQTSVKLFLQNRTQLENKSTEELMTYILKEFGKIQ